MSKVGEQVLVDFYARLEKASEVDETMLAELKALLSSGKKLKADELVPVFEQKAGKDSL